MHFFCLFSFTAHRRVYSFVWVCTDNRASGKLSHGIKMPKNKNASGYAALTQQKSISGVSVTDLDLTWLLLFLDSLLQIGLPKNSFSYND